MTAAASRAEAAAGRAEAGAARSVAETVVSFLHHTLGCDRIFTVPGEAMLALVSLAGQTGMDLVPMRHEAGAGFAALADSWLTGRPGVVAVNRSPGAANASIALDATRSDPSPLLLIMGAPRRGQDRRTGYQSADPQAQLGGVATVITVTDAGALPKCLARAAEILCAVAPGAVVLVVPQDLWDQTVPPGAAPAAGAAPAGPGTPSGPGTPGETERVGARRVGEALAAARYPVVVAGRLLRPRAGAASPGALLERFARAAAVPVLLANKQQDLLDNRLPSYAGDLHQGTHPDTWARLAGADLVVFLGDQPCEVHLKGWYTDQPLVTVHADPAGPGQRLAADPAGVLAVLAGMAWPAPAPERAGWVQGWRDLECGLSRPAARARPDGLDFTHVVTALDECLPDDAIISLDAGNFGGFVHRYLRLRGAQRLLAVADGAMGLGVPGAIAAVRRHPERTVVAVVGDGGLLMTGNEISVARRGGRAPIIIVADNAGYGAIRYQAARAFPGIDCAADLVNPDFVRWAESFGLRAERVDQPEGVPPALRRALATETGYLLHVPTSRVAAHANFDLPG